MKEEFKQEVELHDICSTVMEVLLDFVYTETVHVTVENVQELLPAACLLQLTGLCLDDIFYLLRRTQDLVKGMCKILKKY